MTKSRTIYIVEYLEEAACAFLTKDDADLFVFLSCSIDGHEKSQFEILPVRLFEGVK